GGCDRNGLIGRVDCDAVLAAFVDDLDFLRAVSIIEAQKVPAARFDKPQVILSVGVCIRWFIFAIPKRADHIWTRDVTAFEGHEHFVFFFRQEKRATLTSRHGYGDASMVNNLSI